MATTTVLRASQIFVAKSWRGLFLVMLICLHLSAMWGAEDIWARGMMLAHFGLFMLWQPFMRGERRLTSSQVAAIAAVAVGTLYFLNWWLLALWVAVLAGIVGGKVFLFQALWLRRFYLVVLLYLVSLLLVWIVPNSFFRVPVPSEVGLLAQWGLPVLFVVMMAIPAETDTSETPQVVDFFYAAMIVLLLIALALGSFAFMTVGKIDYITALSFSMLIIAGVLLILSFAWNPRSGFSGLSVYFSRYLLSIGLPFERWLYFLAELSQLETKPERFMKEACSGLAKLPWVTGGFWHTAGESGDFGKVSKNSVEFTNQEIHLRVFTQLPLSPSLVWHFQLLGQMLGEFYVAKQREQKLQQQTYVQAVHETGARMTHDVKNLLQSLNVLCAAAERDAAPNAGGELSALMRRQLPAITQRLQQTLDKLQKPDTNNGRFVTADAWWEGLQRSYAGRGVEFSRAGSGEAVMLPKELFDSAGDNLLQNALRKRRLDESVSIRVTFQCDDTIEFSVCDSGAPVASEVLRGLMRGPVPSETGFGIGLYQTSRLAEISGFSLQLRENDPGRVCFSLRGEVRRGART
ncbi:MAG TPA: ATP-binding protein [Burkholderiales bacterium]|nr:ATP-binding protein [Burkholderiales bacterium]